MFNGLITVEMLRLYGRYKGDPDGFSRARNEAEMRIMVDCDWNKINELVQRISLENSVPVAESFRATTARMIEEHVFNEDAAKQLRELAKL